MEDACPVAVDTDGEPWERTLEEKGYPGGNTNGNIGGRLKQTDRTVHLRRSRHHSPIERTNAVHTGMERKMVMIMDTWHWVHLKREMLLILSSRRVTFSVVNPRKGSDK